MLRKIVVFTFVVCVPVMAAAQTAEKKPIVKKGSAAVTNPSDGQQMFTSYCAPCHGRAGKGDGPAAPALNPKPADLTQLTKKAGGTADLVGDDAATLWHMENLAEGIRTGAALRAPISDGAKSNLLCHLGNIAWYTGRILKTSPKDGHIIGDPEAMKYWSRSYAPGWAPTV